MWSLENTKKNKVYRHIIKYHRSSDKKIKQKSESPFRRCERNRPSIWTFSRFRECRKFPPRPLWYIYFRECDKFFLKKYWCRYLMKKQSRMQKEKPMKNGDGDCRDVPHTRRRSRTELWSRWRNSEREWVRERDDKKSNGQNTRRKINRERKKMKKKTK